MNDGLSGGWLVLAAVRFLAELGLLAAYGYVGVRLGGGGATGLVLAVVLVALAASAWARWVAPKAENRLADPRRLSLEIALFAVAVIGLASLSQPLPALALGGAYAVSAPVGRRGF